MKESVSECFEEESRKWSGVYCTAISIIFLLLWNAGTIPNSAAVPSLSAEVLRTGMVRPHTILADIGTDHAYLPIWLAKQGFVSHDVAR